VETFLFAHQRGHYLANCLASAEAVRWPGPITIIDDGSTDRASRRVLAAAERAGHRVIVQAGRVQGTWGGLQRNMGLALELAEGPATLFLQDDLQFVRPVEDDEIARIVDLVNDPAASPFLAPFFHMESWTESKREGTFRWDPVARVHVRTELNRFQGFSDVAILSPARLRAAGWESRHVEKSASPVAVELFGPMRGLPDPFIVFVPYPYAPRHPLRRRLRDRKRRRTPSAVHIMTPEEVQRMRSAPSGRLPFATEHLRLVSSRRERLIGTTHWSH
jgi:glycosyltransferase involved in cell wall biosynthesis